MPVYVIYARKSTESEDRQVLSIDSQIRELQSLAQNRGIAVSEVLTESHSAKAPGRPVFGALMRRIGRGEIRGVVCWKMDRLARNHFDTGSILQALADGKLQEVITSDRAYTRDGNDRFMGNFELGMATKFIDDLRANVKRGNRARLARGWANYVPPLGYLNDVGTKTVVKDPERFDLVRRMWDLVLTDSLRPSQILRTANEEWGFRTRRFKRTGGNRLSKSVLYSLFQNPFYLGIIRLKSGETFVGAHPPMVSREEFDRVQETIGRPGRPRPKSHEFPLTGIIQCGNCGGSVTAEEHVKPSGRRYVYYHCSHNRLHVPCREPSVSERVLEEQIVALLERLTIPQRVLTWILKKVTASIHAEAARRVASRAMLEAALADATRESENLLALRLRDLVSDEVFLRKKRDIEERRARLSAQVGAPAKTQEELTSQTEKMIAFASRTAELYRSGTTVQRRMILKAVQSNSTLQGRKLLIQLKRPFRMIAEAGSCSNWQRTPEDVRTWIQDTTEYLAVPDFSKLPQDSGQEATARFHETMISQP